MDENRLNKSSSSSAEQGCYQSSSGGSIQQQHARCKEPSSCQLANEMIMMHLRRLWKIIMKKSQKSEFEEVTLCGPKVVGYLSEHLQSGCQWVRYAALDLLCGALPRLGDQADPLLLPLIPRVLSAIQGAPGELRLKALHFTRALRKHTGDMHSLLHYYIEYGLESHNAAVQLACIHGTSIIFDEDLEDPQYALLLPALVRHLEDDPPGEGYLAAFRALRRIHGQIGDDRFYPFVSTHHYIDLLFFEETDPYLSMEGAALPALVDAYQRKRRRVRLGLAFGFMDPALLEALKDDHKAPMALESALRTAPWGEAEMESHVPDLLQMAAGMMMAGALEVGLGVVRELVGRLGLALAPHIERVVDTLLPVGGGAQRVVARLMRELHPMPVLLQVLRAAEEGGGERKLAAVQIVTARIERLPYYYIDITTLCRHMGQYVSDSTPGVAKASKECMDLLMDIIACSPIPDLKTQVVNSLVRDKILGGVPRPLSSARGRLEERRASAERAARKMYGSRVLMSDLSLCSSEVPETFSLDTPRSDVTCQRRGGEGDPPKEEWRKGSPAPWKEEENENSKLEVGAGDVTSDHLEEEVTSLYSSAVTLDGEGQIHCLVKQMNPKKYNFNILQISTPPDTAQSVQEVEEGDDTDTVQPSRVLVPETPDTTTREPKGVLERLRQARVLVEKQQSKKSVPMKEKSVTRTNVREKKMFQSRRREDRSSGRESESKSSMDTGRSSNPKLAFNNKFYRIAYVSDPDDAVRDERRMMQSNKSVPVYVSNPSDLSGFEYLTESDVSLLERKRKLVAESIQKSVEDHRSTKKVSKEKTVCKPVSKAPVKKKSSVVKKRPAPKAPPVASSVNISDISLTSPPEKSADTSKRPFSRNEALETSIEVSDRVSSARKSSTVSHKKVDRPLSRHKANITEMSLKKKTNRPLSRHSVVSSENTSDVPVSESFDEESVGDNSGMSPPKESIVPPKRPFSCQTEENFLDNPEVSPQKKCKARSQKKRPACRPLEETDIASLDKKKDVNVPSMDKNKDVNVPSVDKKKDVNVASVGKKKDVNVTSLDKKKDMDVASLDKKRDIASLDGPKERGDFAFEESARVEEEEIEVPQATYPTIDDISEDTPPFKKGRELPRTPVKVVEQEEKIVTIGRKKPEKVPPRKKKEPTIAKVVVAAATETNPPAEEEEEEEIEEKIQEEEEEDRGVGDTIYKGSQWRRDLEYASKGGTCAWAQRFETSVRRMRPFDTPEAAEAGLKKAMDELEGNQWKQKELAMSAVIRAAKHHPSLVMDHLPRIVVAVCHEVKNFRQSVAGKAILTAGHLYALMGKQLENKLRLVVGALLSKSGNRTLAAYFRLVIKSLFQIISHSCLPKVALAFVKEGSKHANKASRETAAQFLCTMTESLGWKVGLSPPMAPHMIRCANAFAFDCSPLTRYCGKRMLRVFMNCQHFDKLRDQHLDIDAAHNLSKVTEQIETKGVTEELLPIHLIK